MTIGQFMFIFISLGVGIMGAAQAYYSSRYCEFILKNVELKKENDQLKEKIKQRITNAK